MIEVKMPRLSESMTEGKLLVWSVGAGDHVEAGEQLAEIESDKANMEIEAPCAGVICRVHGQPGDMLPVGQVMVEMEAADAREGVGGGSEDAKTGTAFDQKDEADLPSPLERRLKEFQQGQSGTDV